MKAKSATIVKRTFARCIREPRGDAGLEGYLLGGIYKAILCEDRKGPYWRMYPGHEYELVPIGQDKWGDAGMYYETCSPAAFKRNFEEVDQDTLTETGMAISYAETNVPRWAR